MPSRFHPSPARFADRPEELAKLGLRPGPVQDFEDGMRSHGGPGSYEWWYFDCQLGDGSSLVIIFFTKAMMNPGGKLAPYVSLELNRPGQKPLRVETRAPPDAFHASRDGCDVRLGQNSFRGNLHEYDIHFAEGDVRVDVRLTALVPAWRPTSGHIFFGERDEQIFAWLATVPHGEVSVDLNIAGKTEHLDGIGYHDHNWGTVSMSEVITHWYWGRATAGPYSVVASMIFADPAYGGTELPIFMLAKDGRIIADDGHKIRFHLEDEYIDERSGKPAANVVAYDYEDGAERYRVSFRQSATIANVRLFNRARGLKRLLGKLTGFPGSYLRFSGSVRIERFADGLLVEDIQGQSISELIYFGRPTGRRRLQRSGSTLTSAETR